MKKIEHKNIKKGDVWLAENFLAVGSMQKNQRPHVIVTQVTGETVNIAPLTTNKKRLENKYSILIKHTEKNGLDKDSVVLINQSFAASLDLLTKKVGRLSDEDVLKIQLEFIKYFTD